MGVYDFKEKNSARTKPSTDGLEKNKLKFKKAAMKSLALFLLFALLCTTALSAPSLSGQEAVDYPYILVHGIGGWGRDEGINNTLPYWGATTGNLAEFLNEEGYSVFEASVGPLSSAWDRACELYAQLTGTRVDYGQAHSKANNHARYGRTYDSPMFEGWGEKSAGGQIKKINLVGHSFGGLTIRLFVSLLENGAPEEVAATGEDTSPLFLGGQGDLVHSVTTICSPNNGATLVTAFENFNILSPFIDLCVAYTILAGNSPLSGYVDFHLEQFGITKVPGEERSISEIIGDLMLFEGTGTDNAAYDTFPDEARNINQRISFVDGVYYTSYSFCTTVENPYDLTHFPKSSTLSVLKISAFLIGRYTDRRLEDNSFDSRWFANDGLVSVYSARNPKDEPWQDFDGEKLVAGKWNVMPTISGDHGTAIGLFADADQTRQFYLDMFELIENTK